MSWFDTKGLGNFAKNALKEAQKKIDKALDIQDIPEEEKEVLPKLDFSKDEESKTAPKVTPIDSVLAQPSEPQQWGSFTGSFFENPKSSEMITTPPKGGQLINTVTTAPIMSNSINFSMPASDKTKRRSVTSNSDSVELISPPTSPCSGLTSPSEPMNSSSVELITAPMSSSMISPDSGHSLPESIVIIPSDEEPEDDDDSMSFNTVMDDTLVRHSTIQDPKSMSDPVTKRCGALSTTPRILMSLDDALFESQTVNSDSTQSFEDVQMADAITSATPDEKDLVKMNSGPSSSDQNSNDEVETTTSSDIEIISNPNGDSSSANSVSRSSPRKSSRIASNIDKEMKVTDTAIKKMGHFREPSEVSIHSEDSQSDTEKFLHRISELSEILEARELRLLEFGRQNAALQDKNHELQTLLDSMKKNTENLDSEEYTQRLSALEKKFQMSIRERDNLRLQLKAAKQEIESKIPKDDLSQVVAESNVMISELRSEGEKLAKEILQQSNIIKKLRAKEKSSDAIIKKNKEQISDLTEEVERLKKTLNAKEDVERSQIEAVHKMSSEKRKLDEENTQLRSKIEDMNSKQNVLQISLDAAKTELENHRRIHLDLSKLNEEITQLKQTKDKAMADKKEMLHQVNELREKLRISEIGIKMREQKCREEKESLFRRLEEAESRAEYLTQEVSSATIPLMRQIESLQNTLKQRSTAWENREKELIVNLDQSQKRLNKLETFESDSKEKLNMLESRCIDLEKKLSHSLMLEENTKIAFHQAESDYAVKETNFKRQISDLNEIIESTKAELENLSEKFNSLQALYEEECSRANIASGPHCEINESSHERAADDVQRPSNISPVTSIGRNSIEDAMCGNIDWQTDELDCISMSGRQPASVYGTHISLSSFGHNATTLEHLQSILKQREGEVSQLQWELSRLQVERGVLNSEISNLTLELENIKDKLQSYEVLESNFSELQRQYDALLQMYGEKVEKAEELELDLQDVKDMYKAQINDLLRQQNKLTS